MIRGKVYPVPDAELITLYISFTAHHNIVKWRNFFILQTRKVRCRVVNLSRVTHLISDDAKI